MESGFYLVVEKRKDPISTMRKLYITDLKHLRYKTIIL